MIKHFDIKVYGRVQGVFFRYSAKEKAEKFDIKGFVRNERDGSVYIEAEGEEMENLHEFLEWLRKGPKLAKVERVDMEEGQVKGYNIFDMK